METLEPKSKRRSISTQLKFLTFVNALPDDYHKLIHRSQLHRYKNERPTKYLGHELAELYDKKTELFIELANSQRDQKMYQAYVDLRKTLCNILLSVKEINIKAVLYRNRHAIVDAIQKVEKVIPVDEAIKIFKLSKPVFQNWFQEVKYKCGDSFYRLCCKYNPNQLTKKEVGIMKNMLTNIRFKYWPVSSIAFYALRENILCCCVGTWYKYRVLLGIHHVPPKKVNKKHQQGIRAAKPNEIWHADITIFKTIDGKIKYIYFVIDNFSRKILSYRIHHCVCKHVRKDTVVEAFKHVKDKKQKIKLIVDGGPENNNRVINDFCLTQKNLKKLIALKDINYSNSMVEATNFLIKYRYIFVDKLKFEEDLDKMLPLYVEDFNAVRPHGQLNGLTPDEAYSGIFPENVSYAFQMIQSRENRIKHNQNVRCNLCVT